MKPIVKYFLVLFLTLSVLNGFSQEEERKFSQRPGFSRQFSHDTLKIPKYRLQILKTNPAALLFSQIPYTGELRVMYERVELPKMATVIGASFIMLSPVIGDTLREYFRINYGVGLRVAGYRLQAAQKFYITGWDSPQGLYIAPHASYNWTNWVFRNNNGAGQVVYAASITFLNVNVLIGFQKLIWKRVAIDVNVGVGWRYNFIRERDTQTVIPINMSEGTSLPSWLKFSFTNNFGFAF